MPEIFFVLIGAFLGGSAVFAGAAWAQAHFADRCAAETAHLRRCNANQRETIRDLQAAVAEVHAAQQAAAEYIVLLSATAQAAVTQMQAASGVQLEQSVSERFCWN